ncbi:hypothetical protein D6764_04940 [Candidatus Woesearchaeota archaeon]|nr:MAG: hypothetical protein D6764_04940 [Candidatus Woesearchaeota archaeon]
MKKQDIPLNGGRERGDCMNKKAQAAMEFLMTYGWAILVVLAAIGALAYFGVLSPSNFVPNKCTVQGFTCADFELTAGTPGTVTLYLTNNMGFPTTNVTVSLKDQNGNECCAAGDACATDASFNNGEQLGAGSGYQFTGCDLVSGQRFQGTVTVTYTNANTGVSHTTTGDVSGRVP